MFPTENSHIKINKLSNQWHSKPLWEYKSFFNPAEPISDDKMKSLHAVSKIQQQPCVSLPFCKVKNKIRRAKIRADDRIPEAVEAFEKVMEESRAKRGRG
jgi:hypothetical protein